MSWCLPCIHLLPHFHGKTQANWNKHTMTTLSPALAFLAVAGQALHWRQVRRALPHRTRHVKFWCCIDSFNRSLGLCYPHFPTEQDFIHSVLSSGDICSYTQKGKLYLLGRFAQEWPRLQAGGLVLPDLVEFYQWLHTALGKPALGDDNSCCASYSMVI